MTSSPEFSGLSGANLGIMTRNGNSVVRKTSANLAGNDRLRLQMEKQISFINLCGPISAPRVLESGIDSTGKFYFDMEFVSGLDGHRFLERCSPRDLQSFSARLLAHLSSLKILPVIAPPGKQPSLFHSCLHKLVEIHHRDVSLGNELAGIILGKLSTIQALRIEKEGFCHGDFTLENMLIDGQGDVYFVDFLDSTFEHPVQDLVKLSQDIHGGWFRTKGRRLSSAVVAHIQKTIQPAVDRDFPFYSDVRDTLLALNFCRILPYVSNDVQKEFVLNQIKKFIHYIP